MYTGFGGCLLGIGIGFLAARWLTFSIPKRSGAHGSASEISDQAEQTRMDAWLGSFENVTTQVQAQVNQHSDCVNQITTTLEQQVETDLSPIFTAGQNLLGANKQLQAELADAKKEIESQRERLQSYAQESRTDPLTGLANRRAFEIELVRAFGEFRRSQSAFCLALLDIDNFKRINDQHGHMVGDQMLKHFARRVSSALRDSDFIARFGGEEFVLILPHTRLDDAVRVVERIRTTIDSSQNIVGDLTLTLTASFGIKEVGPTEIATELIQRSDVALYAAKKAGRNRCFIYDEDGARMVQPEVETLSQSATLQMPAVPANASVVEPA
jgi:diguanylate cyclase